MKRLLCLAAALLLASCARHKNPPDIESGPAVSVKVAQVATPSHTPTQPIAGTVRPADRATVAARIMGEVATINAHIGQIVKTGDLLATLSANEIGARREQSLAARAQAKRDHDREAALLTRGASTEETVRSLADRLKIAEAAVAEAETMLAYTQITAPFEGVITERSVNTGDLAAPGTPLFAIESMNHLRIELAVPASLPRLPIGASLQATTSDGRIVSALLAEFSPSADEATRSHHAKLDLPPGTGSHSGDFVRVLWPAREPTDVLTVPASAVGLFGQMERLFVVENGYAVLRLVKTAPLAGGDSVVILSGINAGDTIVLDPPASLRDGQRLEIAR